MEKLEIIDSKRFGLSSRIKIYKKNPSTYLLDRIRKSRIIMKDAEKILEITNQIKTIEPNMNIEICVSEAICSKSVRFLESHNIPINHQ